MYSNSYCFWPIFPCHFMYFHYPLIFRFGLIFHDHFLVMVHFFVVSFYIHPLSCCHFSTFSFSPFLWFSKLETKTVFVFLQYYDWHWSSTFQPTTNSKLIPATFIIFMNCRNLVLLICVCSVPKCITFDLTTLVDCLMIAVRGAFITCV